MYSVYILAMLTVESSYYGSSLRYYDPVGTFDYSLNILNFKWMRDAKYLYRCYVRVEILGCPVQQLNSYVWLLENKKSKTKQKK